MSQISRSSTRRGKSIFDPILGLFWSRVAISLVFAVLITLILGNWDQNKRYRNESHKYLMLAKQAASQVESLLFLARERGEKDPLNWAVRKLSNAEDEKMLGLSRVKSNGEKEQFGFDTKSNNFWFIKEVFPEEGQSLRVDIKSGMQGIFGATSKAEQDGTYIILGCIFYFLISTAVSRATKRWFNVKESFSLPKQNSKEIDLNINSKVGVKEANALMSETGVQIRDLLMTTKTIISLTAQNASTVQNVNITLQDNINRLRELRNLGNELKSSINQVEIMGINVLLESTRLSDSNQTHVKNTLELHQSIQKFKYLDEKLQNGIRSLEGELEPIVSDIFKVNTGYADVMKAKAVLDADIRRTTMAMIKQVEFVKKSKAA